MSGIPESLLSMFAHDVTVLTGIENGSAKWIPLTKGMYAIVDSDDYERIAAHKWHANKMPYASYAVRTISDSGRRRDIKMHRVIMNLGYGHSPEVHHDNHNGLDNRKHNLKISSTADHAKIHDYRSNNTSGYTGISWQKVRKRWRARIQLNKKVHFLGDFIHLEDAASILRKWSKEHPG